MSVSPIAFTREMVRRNVNQDENFVKRLLYYFELQIPRLALGGGVVPGTSNSFMFPLILPPESYSMTEPFSVEVIPTQKGGLYVEENGIIQRVIRLRGTTGFKPRMLKTYGSMGDANTPPAPMHTNPIGIDPKNKSYSRNLPVTMFAEVSGQRHFQYLQDSVFRTYGDLKRDPATAKDTMMFFHNPKDDEHWRVVPNQFTLEKDKSRPTLYYYNIELLAIDKADSTADLDFDDKNILDNFYNALYMAKLGEDLVSGAIDDMTALQQDLGNVLSNLTVLLDGLTNILTSVQDFTSGTERLIQVPYSSIISMTEFMDEAANIASDPNQSTVTVPIEATQMIRRAIDGLEMIGANPSTFETSNELEMQDIKDRQELRRSVTAEKQKEVASGTGPTSFLELEELGTGLTPGEVVSSKGQVSIGGELSKYRSVRKVTVGKGDTLATLASQYMGDARLWQYIAVANGLKPPYVDDMASTPLHKTEADERPFRESVGIGSEIVIPSNDASPLDYPLLPVLGTRIEEPIENQLLGIDALLEPVVATTGDSRALYDVAINTELGSNDAKLIEGLDNMTQVIMMRLSTEQGTDLLYKHVGLKRIIGLNFALADLANARYRIREAVGADPRVASVRNLVFEQQDDALQATMDALLRGFTETRPIQVTI